MKRHIVRWMMLGTVLVSVQASAQVYHYIDESGRKVFVDRKSQIPEKYRDDVSIKASRSSRSPSLEGVPDDVAPDDKTLTPDELRSELQAYMSRLEMPVEIRGNSVLVPVQVRYGARNRTLNLLLDTGASSTIVYDDVATILMASTLPSGRARVADGSVVDMQKLTFSEFKVGPYSMSPATAQVMEHKGLSQHDGLLGMDFLRQARYEIDFDRSVIIWALDRYREAEARLKELDNRTEAEDGAANDGDRAPSPDDAPVE